MRKFVVAALLGSALIGPAQAGKIEDAFRGFIDRLRSAGQAISEYRQSIGFQEVKVPTLEKRVDELPLGRREYAVFVTPGCRGCDAAVKYLKAKKVDFEVLDVGKGSNTAREAYALTKGQGFPVILVGTQRLTGWNERLFKQAIRADAQGTLQRQQGDGA